MTFPDEILQLVFYELNDPTPLTLVSKRFHNFSQDNFIRAHYFLARYGETQALFYALGRGRILNKSVLNVSSLEVSGQEFDLYMLLGQTDSVGQRRAYVSVPCPARHSPLLSLPGSLHQDHLGPQCPPACFRLLHGTRYKKVRGNPCRKERGRWIHIRNLFEGE